MSSWLLWNNFVIAICSFQLMYVLFSIKFISVTVFPEFAELRSVCGHFKHNINCLKSLTMCGSMMGVGEKLGKWPKVRQKFWHLFMSQTVLM